MNQGPKVAYMGPLNARIHILSHQHQSLFALNIQLCSTVGSELAHIVG